MCDPSVEDCFDGGQLPDACNSIEEALSLPECALALGTALPPLPDGTLRYLSFAGDKDYYAVQLPGNLTARSLITIQGGYAVPSTPVDFTINVLRTDGGSSVALGVDNAPGAPQPVRMTFPFAESNARLVLQVRDAEATNQPKFDVRSPYELIIDLKDDPDVNEPNDSVAAATAIALTPAGAEQTGSAPGFLSTTGDRDYFKFAVPGGGRKILYLSVKGAPGPPSADGGAGQLSPPLQYILGYTLFDSADRPIAEGTMLNQFLAVDLATARLLPGGEYTLKVEGKRIDNKPALGDPRPAAQYTVQVRLLDDLDTAEPNDTLATAQVRALSVGQTQRFTARVSYVPDSEWFAVDLPANASATVLRYRLNRPGPAGRFPPLPGLEDRQLRVFTQTSAGGNPDDRKTRCKSDATVCPKGYDGDPSKRLLVESLCESQDPPLCIWAERNAIAPGVMLDFKNMDGALPVAAHAATVRYHFVVQDDGQNFADDRTLDLDVTWDADGDDTARQSLPAQTQAEPVDGEVAGVLSHGYGRYIEFDPDRGEGSRGPDDYDAVPTDVDRFQFSFPAGTTGSTGWSLQWDVLNQTDGGVPAGQLALDVEFCDGTAASADGGSCSVVQRTLGYQGGRIDPWYGMTFQDRTQLWSQAAIGGGVRVAALPAGCFCFEPRFTAAGRYFVRVLAVDRVSNGNLPYRLTQSLAGYPGSFTADGGTRACPALCEFSKN